MPSNQNEITRRTAAALAAIKKAADDPESVALFHSHHLTELDAAYWKKHTGSARPTAKHTLDLLQLRDHWDEPGDNGIRVFDFTLPDDVTNYVLSVEFNAAGEIEGIALES